MILVDALSALTAVRHGFFTRYHAEGGTRGDFNCAYRAGDDEAVVGANRAACAGALGVAPTHLVTVKQSHTADVLVVEKPVAWRDAPVADAIVSRIPGLALAVLTADCTPVLMADGVAGVVAAAHAGWRGALDGVLENTVTQMEKLGAARARIVAAVGPCIGQSSYEVGPEFASRFTARDSGFARYFTAPKANGHCHFDLAGFVSDRLKASGVGTVVGGTWDTCADDARFFSYRRSVLHQEADYGRQLSAIALTVRAP
ncbi:MAG: peptidoglycan editing factor PgeF [Rhodospirillaceae bacterium]|nr:peptidoglycan editing factor PgeF [Rhodospirillaceae bacterium]